MRVLRRTVTGLAANKVWLYSVDELEDVGSGQVAIQIVRWQARHDDLHHPIWMNRSRYNVRSLEQWETATTAVESYLDHSRLRHDPAFVDEFEPVGRGVSRAQRAPRTIRSAQADSRDARIQDLTKLVKEANAARAAEAAARRKARTWLRQLKRHAKTYRKTFGEFRSLVGSPATTETDVHNFIERSNPFWLFGLEYLGLDSKVPFPEKKPVFFFDLMLRRLDGFFDLVELKGPHDSLFDRRTKNRWKLNSKLSEALGQVIVYLDACDRYRKAGLFKPKAVIVIGSKGTDNLRQRRLLGSRLAHVEILTYSELVERGSQLLKHLEGWKD